MLLHAKGALRRKTHLEPYEAYQRPKKILLSTLSHYEVSLRVRVYVLVIGDIDVYELMMKSR